MYYINYRYVICLEDSFSLKEIFNDFDFQWLKIYIKKDDDWKKKNVFFVFIEWIQYDADDEFIKLK